jgi:hypothetical protein
MGKTVVHSLKRRVRFSILRPLGVCFVLPVLFIFIPVRGEAQYPAGSLAGPANGGGETFGEGEFIGLNRELSLYYTRLVSATRDSNGGEVSSTKISSTQEMDGLIESALLFWPGNPDALYFKSLRLVEKEEFDEAIRCLTVALGGRVFQFSDRDEVLRLYLSLLVDHDQSSLALTILSSMAPQKLKQQVFLELQVKALKNQNLRGLLAVEAERALSLFPKNDLFRALHVKYSEAEKIRVKRRILEESGGHFYGRETFRQLIRSCTQERQLDALLDMYKNRWGEDTFFLVHSLRTEKGFEPRRIDELFRRIELVEGDLLTLLYDILLERGEASLFEKAFPFFGGTVVRDPDGDGVYEVREEYRDGKIFFLKANMDGDPDPELEIFFEQGKPQKTTVLGLEGAFFEVEYRRYPELSVVRFPSGEGGLLEIAIAPFTTFYPFPYLSSRHFPEAFPFPDVKALPPLYRLMGNASTIAAFTAEEIRAGEETGRRDLVVKFSRERSNIEAYREGKVEMRGDMDESVLERKSLDPDRDGFFEILEFYREGELYRIAYDGNENGVYEYIEEFEPVHLRKWDTDEDGVADYREQ